MLGLCGGLALLVEGQAHDERFHAPLQTEGFQLLEILFKPTSLQCW
jgi:hypothetical protein